jgi:hypothetical protein
MSSFSSSWLLPTDIKHTFIVAHVDTVIYNSINKRKLQSNFHLLFGRLVDRKFFAFQIFSSLSRPLKDLNGWCRKFGDCGTYEFMASKWESWHFGTSERSANCGYFGKYLHYSVSCHLLLYLFHYERNRITFELSLLILFIPSHTLYFTLDRILRHNGLKLPPDAHTKLYQSFSSFSPCSSRRALSSSSKDSGDEFDTLSDVGYDSNLLISLPFSQNSFTLISFCQSKQERVSEWVREWVIQRERDRERDRETDRQRQRDNTH